MDWIETQINDDRLFPVDPGIHFLTKNFLQSYSRLFVTFLTAVPFPKDFQATCKKILTRLFRVFVHVYIHHFEHLMQIGAVTIICKSFLRFSECFLNLLLGSSRKHMLQAFLLFRRSVRFSQR